MDNYQVNNLMETPPGGWKFMVEETGQWVPQTGSMVAYHDLKSAVTSHFKANNIPVQSIDSRIQNQMCQRLPPETCSRNGAAQPAATFWSNNSFSNVVQGMVTLAAWVVKDKAERVSQEEAERRAAICITCPFNVFPDGCSSCSMPALRSLVKAIVPAGETRYDTNLRACSVCLCELKAKIWLPIESLRRWMPQSQLDRLPEKCWLNVVESPKLP